MTLLILYLRMNDENIYGMQIKMIAIQIIRRKKRKYETRKKTTIKHEKTIKK